MTESSGTFSDGRTLGVKLRNIHGLRLNPMDLSKVYVCPVKVFFKKTDKEKPIVCLYIQVKDKKKKPLAVIKARSYRDPFVVGFVAGLEGR